jgi:mono/diheme cytochrome c family protein
VGRLLALVVLGAAIVAAGCGGEETTSLRGADTANGKLLFVQKCGSCHTLGDAATLAQVGPNLDNAFRRAREEGFADSTIFRITLDQIDLAAAPMPTDLVAGQDAVDVAAYVASAAGKPPPEETTTGQTGTGQTGTSQTTTGSP